MNNKFMKRIVAVVASVILLSSCAFATTITSVTYENASIDFQYDANGANKVTYLAYTVKEVEEFTNANDSRNYTGTDGTKYEFCAYVALDQLEDDEITGTKAIAVDGEKVAEIDVAGIVFKSGDSKGSAAAVEFIETASSEETYTVTFLNGNGQTLEAKTGIASGTVINTILPTTDPTKAASGTKRYTFLGWYTNSALTAKLADTAVSGDITIYPKFVEIPMHGDANANGKVDTADISQIKMYVNAADKGSLPAFYKVGKDITIIKE